MGAGEQHASYYGLCVLTTAYVSLMITHQHPPFALRRALSEEGVHFYTPPQHDKRDQARWRKRGKYKIMKCKLAGQRWRWQGWSFLGGNQPAWPAPAESSIPTTTTVLPVLILGRLWDHLFAPGQCVTYFTQPPECSAGVVWLSNDLCKFFFFF
jgi:hypothetical protein